MKKMSGFLKVIELSIVVVIIAILAAVCLPIYYNAENKQIYSIHCTVDVDTGIPKNIPNRWYNKTKHNTRFGLIKLLSEDGSNLIVVPADKCILEKV